MQYYFNINTDFIIITIISITCYYVIHVIIILLLEQKSLEIRVE